MSVIKSKFLKDIFYRTKNKSKGHFLLKDKKMDENKRKTEDKNIQKSLEISVFGNNENLSFIHKKSEKISCAIYLVTNHLDDKEPLKRTIRSESLGLIKDTISLTGNFSENLWSSEKLGRRITAIISFLDLLFGAGLISKANHLILRTEIGNLASFLEVEANIINYEGRKLESVFFDVPGRSAEEIGRIMETLSLSQEEKISGKEVLSDNLKDISKGHKDKGQMSFINKKDISVQKERIFRRGSARKQKIISFIKLKKEVSIKDITSVIKDFSEKTLQRDLISLVKAGVLKKRGKKRWSLYYLA
ncbi:hypothetical protein COV42_02245 [Candidatus Campbellbacteria bacterium CG11_big_fil_rev_8_21_14_0_20_44_21]|uniref:HTH deoR-type domain-containing protein n=1 Tax=Candidatus Campbellbacteria bacterium CG22_combo_CG10-13_8_21_14_all_43_18 TaxID=1974530 RepID=A0A2H0DW53_9BACT|nr:MAG: hypothetical protein COW82_02245 [Candidatus Campbellbacteria bacterium CG22_combo_CG10-13_8_21_14_all_43_18]PIR24161.1 MAG: hypothetical protein COV42_02245 [Candidatus Campbellbacteria bacterium CG11_big_fil_rev_8_21_14_0_20_44_21]